MKPLTPALALCVLALAGCAGAPDAKDLLDFTSSAVPLAPAEADAQAKRYTPAAGRALIYVYRGGPDPGAARPLTIALDDKPVGALIGRTYYALEVAPGRRNVSLMDGSSTAVRIDAAAGARYFVELGTETGYNAPKGYLVMAREGEARETIARARLAQSQLEGAGAAPVAAKPGAAAVAQPAARQAVQAAPEPGVGADTRFAQQLRELKQLQKEGVITEQEFEAKKKQILERM